ncbi:MAG: polysaccharide deacetylase family protein [Planctomycetota bacterium]|jgi:hypothetical protein
MKIQFVLTDDWELRGDGSGDIHRLQFQPIRRLTQIYEQFGFRGSFFVEVMQQLKHLTWGRRYPVLRERAYQWEKVVRDTLVKGHDIQLHIHPQWSDAEYTNAGWRLSHKWSLLEYPSDKIKVLLKDSKTYLEDLLQPVNPEYDCIAFRASKWSLAPNRSILQMLANLGIVFDTSIVPGIVFKNDTAQFDYRKVDEAFLPYYPRMTDARRVSNSDAPITCVPTHTFNIGKMGLLIQATQTACRLANLNFLRSYLTPPNNPQALRGRVSPPEMPQPEPNHRNVSKMKSGRQRIADLLSALRSPAFAISDLSALSYFEMKMMLQNIRQKAQNAGWTAVPVIITSHTKNIIDFKPIEKFCRSIAAASDMEVITSTQLARNLQSGVYPVVQKVSKIN